MLKIPDFTNPEIDFIKVNAYNSINTKNDVVKEGYIFYSKLSGECGKPVFVA